MSPGCEDGDCGWCMGAASQAEAMRGCPEPVWTRRWTIAWGLWRIECLTASQAIRYALGDMEALT